jgi:hypothetical protein
MSAGLHFSGVLGQGDDIVEISEFKKIEGFPKNVKVKKVSIKTKHVLVLTKDN